MDTMERIRIENEGAPFNHGHPVNPCNKIDLVPREKPGGGMKMKNWKKALALVIAALGPWIMPLAALAQEGEDHFAAWQLIEPLGVTTLSLLLVTAAMGLFMRRKPALLHKWHKRIAFATVAAAVTHAALVFLFH
jgi:hypothetical protein